MSNKNYGKTLGFRTKDKSEAQELEFRAESLKVSKNYTKKDIFKAGLLALEEGEKETQLKYRKQKEANERDNLLKEALILNKHIGALNKRLIAKYPKRNQNLNPNNKVLTIKIYDENGQELDF